MARFKKPSKTRQTNSKRVRVKKKVLTLKTVEDLVSVLCPSSQHGNDFLIMAIVLVGLVALHLLPPSTGFTKCVTFPDHRGMILQSSTPHRIYYSCSVSYMPCCNLLWVKHSSMVGHKDSGFPRKNFHFRFPKRSSLDLDVLDASYEISMCKTLATFCAPLQT